MQMSNSGVGLGLGKDQELICGPVISEQQYKFCIKNVSNIMMTSFQIKASFQDS